jgi:hypothetical protein
VRLYRPRSASLLKALFSWIAGMPAEFADPRFPGYGAGRGGEHARAAAGRQAFPQPARCVGSALVVRPDASQPLLPCRQGSSRVPPSRRGHGRTPSPPPNSNARGFKRLSHHSGQRADKGGPFKRSRAGSAGRCARMLLGAHPRPCAHRGLMTLESRGVPPSPRTWPPLAMRTAAAETRVRAKWCACDAAQPRAD